MTKQSFRSGAFVGLVLLASLQSAQAQTVFGLTFGQPVEAPTCAGHIDIPSHPKDGFCITPKSDRKLVRDAEGATGIADLLFKHNDLPFWTGSRLRLILVQGRLAGIISSTGGNTTHKSVTSDLNERFGAPSETVKQTAQNLMGATFDNSISIWNTGQLVVTYTPMLTDVRVGQVDFFTPAGLTWYRGHLHEQAPKPSRGL